ncbi:MAG: DNA-directed RNA polymerase subunit K [Candidatus Pacearchaeota archaeon]|jgi:DNA-directed RNA polymerase subunit K
MDKPIARDKLTKYEKTRILGARALQIAMDAPLLVDIDKEELEERRFQPMAIANIEFEADVLPITVKQPMPKKKSVKVRRSSSSTNQEQNTEDTEEREEKEIIEEGEIMELANPEDEEGGEEGTAGREGSEELQ